LTRNTSSRIVWITGASSGFGRALALAFAHAGDIVIATGRSLHALKLLQRKREGRVEVHACDVRDERAVERLAKSVLRRHSRIDILVNNAGITSFAEFTDTSVREFDDILETNLRGLFLTTRSVLPSMLRRRSGLILNILSYAAKTTYTKSVAYSAAKAGAEAMMNVLRAEVRDKGIRVMNIFPGAMLTPMWPPHLRKRYSTSMMSADDVAALVVHLTQQPKTLHIEELIVRPPQGDLRV
jgi:NADP-dependent 3-hydroxy acid dehydrogenase YdfG